MTSIERFVGFRIQLSDANRSRYTTFRIKTPRHVLEGDQDFYCRILALCHQYNDGLEFAPIRNDPDAPVIWKKDFLGNISTWIEVGETSKRKLHRALRGDGIEKIAAYFFNQKQIDDFCRELRGSTTNWIEPISFYRIDPEIVSALVEFESSGNEWIVTIADTSFYLECSERNFSTTIESIDMWQEFQTSIRNDN